MKFRSYIFSFDTLHLRRTLPAGAMFAFLLLLAIELGVSRREWPFRLVSSNYVGAFLNMEDELTARRERPLITMFGNSRCGKIAPAQIGRMLRVPEDYVLNLAFPGSDPFVWRLFQRRDHDKLETSRITIICVDGWQYNYFQVRKNPLFRHFAAINERWLLDSDFQVLLGGVLRTFEEREFYTGAARNLFRRSVRSMSGGTGPTAPPEIVETIEQTASRYFDEYRFSRGMQDYYLKSVIETALGDGQKVLLLQLPVRDGFMNLMRSKYSAQYNAYKEVIVQIKMVPLILFEDASNIGLQNSDFEDYGHFSAKGAERFVDFFSRYLFETHPDFLEAQRASK